MNRNWKDEYTAFRLKLLRYICGCIVLSALLVLTLYLFFWRQRMGNWIVWGLETLFGMGSLEAYYFYAEHFRGQKPLFFGAAVLLVSGVLLWRVFCGITRYFNEIDQGIDSLLADDGAKICLSPEMLPFERKLNAAKQTLEQRKAETAQAEQKKDELVLYLAHDIRTPLTSVIGYLSLLEEAPDMPAEQREKQVHIALQKAYRLEKMIQEFFEITRYNSRQITLIKEPVDLYFMLVQLLDELSPLFSRRGNTTALQMEETLVVHADADKLARVFSNLLKNAAAYSYPGTPVVITAERGEGVVRLLFCNQGPAIPADTLSALFDKFYRLDKARISDTGGTGLGLAIAKEIVLLHGGKIWAGSRGESIVFTVELPIEENIQQK